MLRSVIDITREILIDAEINGTISATRITSRDNGENAMVGEEVGGANKSVDSFVMKTEQRSPT